MAGWEVPGLLEIPDHRKTCRQVVSQVLVLAAQTGKDPAKEQNLLSCHHSSDPWLHGRVQVVLPALEPRRLLTQQPALQDTRAQSRFMTPSEK